MHNSVPVSNNILKSEFCLIAILVFQGLCIGAEDNEGYQEKNNRKDSQYKTRNF
ncbi:hypothetical protein TorRG33x02_154160 [Trema orientale]|uniref:Uncharacterized protein n=1 Tax=Trema orientale TaxID=63057 RepID=A0A2P5ET50_TREOI|nr:hypothetical protein TorRG33x02_154160 [Trema orientale]